MISLVGGRRPLVASGLALLFLLMVMVVVKTSGGSVDESLEPSHNGFTGLGSQASVLPASVARQLRDSPDRADWARARAIPLKRHQAWVAPNPHGLCLVRRDSSVAVGVVCATHRYLTSHALFIASLSPRAMETRRDIVGIVSSGARGVSLVTPGFPTVRPDLTDGAFEHRDAVPVAPQSALLIRGRR